jgi:ubiquinone/menaquinone biosynthesis C-methylase UbiE
MERVVEDEWLDEDRGTPEEVDAALHSLALANRRFGGVRLHARLLRHTLTRVSHRRRPHILEVASGRADVLKAALRRLDVIPEITLLDRSAAHLPDPRAWHAKWAAPRVVQGNALDLPFPDASVDIVSCCLFLHHLEPSEIVCFLAEAQRVARVAVIINDLERTALHYRSRISKHDGPASVRRAYTRRELAGMIESTSRSFVLERAWLYRLGAVLWCDRQK